ncbi:tyrosine-type recombinase/integrase [Streptomyces sioyaensis]|uniref:tyrosine-type recombinase/integrase n=1 Tax=Streptomyces sioyaensis TaxID=67364 RepID=UPI00379FC9AC
MTVITTAPPLTEHDGGDTTAELMAMVEPEFLSVLGWSPQVRLLFLPYDHPLLGMPVCLVSGCSLPSVAKGLCSGCYQWWKQQGEPPMEGFTAEGRVQRRQIGVQDCSVARCERPVYSSRTPLCVAHRDQLHRRELSLAQFLALDDVVPLPGFGWCAVAACHRKRPGTDPYCHAHRVRWSHAVRHGQVDAGDEQHWRTTTTPITANNEVSLRGLPERLVAEVLYGLQARTQAGFHTSQTLLRNLLNPVRELELSTLTAVKPEELARGCRGFYNSLITFIDRARKTPESERTKDVWDGAIFGHTGRLHFTDLHQPWLREAVKEWAFTTLPQRRGRAMATVQDIVRAFALLSESLRLQREDRGEDLCALGRHDIAAFLNRLAYLHGTEALSTPKWVVTCRFLRGNLAQMRSLGLTRSGRPLHGLPEDFALLAEDIPDEPEDSEAGKDLPLEVMRQLCEHLPRLADLSRNGPEHQVATELLIDTGRRPQEICRLPLDCLAQDSGGQHELIYNNDKANRKGRRLPISQATAGVITRQQERVRAAFPHTPSAELVLLPTCLANPHGRKPIGSGWLSQCHREWVGTLPEILVPTRVEADGQLVTRNLPFDKSKIFLYAYRHTYCQRHADAGVPPDVLRDLMDHRRLETAQTYYRVTSQRRREAVDRVTTMQFDRRGNRIWRQAQVLLDAEYARRAIGEVQVPYGLCTEPSNVAAGGHDCPVRFRCVGCGHFRTDVSYLPDLEAYLADLLRNRERLAAFTSADDWAKAETMPSDEEITRVRRLVQRVRADLDDLTDEDRTQIREAVAVVRRSRTVALGMPRIRQPLPDLRPDRTP